MKHCILIGFIMLVLCFNMPVISADWETQPGEHPFLLVRKEEYENLRNRMNRSPWKELGESAIANAKNLPMTTTGSYTTRSFYHR